MNWKQDVNSVLGIADRVAMLTTVKKKKNTQFVP